MNQNEYPLTNEKISYIIKKAHLRRAKIDLEYVINEVKLGNPLAKSHLKQRMLDLITAQKNFDKIEII